MRKYTLVFMEQKIGVPYLTPVPGFDGEVTFEAPEDDAALLYVRERFMQRMQQCVRADLSSMAIVSDPSGRGVRLLDDSHENPHFQETYLRYDDRTQRLEVDFVSTATNLLPSSFRRA